MKKLLTTLALGALAITACGGDENPQDDFARLWGDALDKESLCPIVEAQWGLDFQTAEGNMEALTVVGSNIDDPELAAEVLFTCSFYG